VDAAADAVTASRERTRAVLNAALDCVIAMDADGRVLEWNPAAERSFGFTTEEAVGRDMATLIVPPDLRARHRAGLARYLAGGTPTMLDRRIEITACRADGTEVPVELTITRVALRGPPVFIGYLRDISDRHDAERELRESRARIAAAADEARRRIERDLHDGAQQRLVGLSLTLKLARRRTEDPVLGELLDEAMDDLASATAELRELARGIHPAVLNHGLEAALRSLASRAGVPTTVTFDSTGPLPEPVELAAYFVASEALANVAKYAQADRATVRVSCRDGVARIEIADDGVGGADETAGTGIQGLADRVAALDGTLRISSPPGAGTVVTAELPCGS
jgi:PAS domain S-box-containing protein